MGEEILFIFL